MDSDIRALELRMTEAAAREDFEEARLLRDRINLLRGGASADEAARADTSGLSRQKPGAMGIGTNKAKPLVPRGWKAPKKPDPMTSGKRSKRP